MEIEIIIEIGKKKGWEEFRGEWKVFILINFLSRRWVNFG